MFSFRKTTQLALAAFALAWAPSNLAAQAGTGAMAQQQQMQRVQQRMQQHAQALGQSVQHMQRIQQRAQQLQQTCDQQAQQLQQRQNLQLHEQQQLRNQQSIGEMANAVSGAAQQMTRAMEGLRLLARDPVGNWTGEAEGEMLRLRERLHQVTGELEEGLQIMERLHEQLNQGTQGSGGEES